MSLQITFAGPLTTVQDLGRVGYRKDAFGTSGVMDKRAAVIANRLVGNDDNAAVLEMTIFGIKAVVLDATTLCFSGANMPFHVNDVLVQKNTSINVFPGDTLSIGAAAGGCRGYLAVRGGFDVPVVMGSRSTNLKCAIGGFKGRKIAVGDILPVVPVPPLDKQTSFAAAPYFGQGEPIRVVLGPQDNMFDQAAIDTFLQSEYVVSPQSDRMGIRLSGAPVVAPQGVDIISDGIVCGSVQVPKNGQPILLLSDCQTTGGYAKIATVISADLPAVGQMRPGDKLRFALCSVEEAQAILKEEEKQLPKKLKRR